MAGNAEAPRIPPLEPPYEPEVEEMLRKWMVPEAGAEPLNVFRTLARHPELAARMGVVGAGILGHPHLDPREREIVIHRATARCGTEYEWGVHVAVYGRRLGLTEEQIAATVHGSGDDPTWSARERLLVRLVDELHDTATVSDALWGELANGWPDDQLVELVVIAGWYRTISQLINAARVELEPWAERFPRRGQHRTPNISPDFNSG